MRDTEETSGELLKASLIGLIRRIQSDSSEEEINAFYDSEVSPSFNTLIDNICWAQKQSDADNAE